MGGQEALDKTRHRGSGRHSFWAYTIQEDAEETMASLTANGAGHLIPHLRDTSFPMCGTPHSPSAGHLIPQTAGHLTTSFPMASLWIQPFAGKSLRMQPFSHQFPVDPTLFHRKGCILQLFLQLCGAAAVSV